MTFNTGTITSSTSEQNLFDVTAEAHFAFYLFTHNMAANDSITIRVYLLDEEGTTMRKIETLILEHAQSDPIWFYPFLPAQQYKVSIQRTAGTDRSYNWTRMEVT